MGFLQKLTAAGTRIVPMRAARSVRRIDRVVDAPAPTSVPRGDAAPPGRSEARDAIAETAIAKPPASSLRVHVPPPPQADAAPSVAVAREPSSRAQAPAIVEPEPAQPRAPMPVVPSSSLASAAIDRPRVEPETTALEVSGSAPLRRMPTLSSDALDDRPARPIAAEHAPQQRPAPGVPPRVLDADAGAVPPPRVGPRRMKATASERPLPLPTLEPPASGAARAPAPPPDLRATQNVDAEPRAARDPRLAPDSAARPQPSPSAVVQLVPESPRINAAVRHAPAPAGLTIHKLELQVVERPRDVVPPPPPVTDAAPAPAPAEWPDRRHHGFVW